MMIDDHKNRFPGAVPRDSIPLLQVTDLHIHACSSRNRHANGQQIVQALSFRLAEGQTLALVGESGSGKSMTAAAVAGLLPKQVHAASGSIRWKGEEVLQGKNEKRSELLGIAIGWIFQDYHGSFTPFLTIGRQMQEVLRVHRRLRRAEAREAALDSLKQVGLPAERVYNSYAFQLSGGQCQRAALATALLLEPQLIIADEPTTALDVLTAQEILLLLKEVQRRTGCALLLITHDLHQVFRMADRIAVMKGGRIVEDGYTEQIRHFPSHPYTRELLEACPKLHGRMTDSSSDQSSGHSMCKERRG